MSQTIDYEYAIREIRRKMWDPRGSKAAVMVGAGFSRNAVPTRNSGQRAFPDWAALTQSLIDRLYSQQSEREKVLASMGATSSALRLAEEFECAHGRPALIDAVRESLPDGDFVPARVHEDLMELNWADVFTTNYDTMLERATLQRPHLKLRSQRYNLVLDSSDLPLARRPRIIKLHGTLPDLTNLVLTEEDFRRYPIDHAPFVNAVRSSLTENVFCLIGFSGDDPNFLAWTGWIRDVLKRSSPPIYLFRGSPLKPFQQKLLEQRNIIPIPICEISGKADLAGAFGWLFAELAKEVDEPTVDWNLGPTFVPSYDPADASCTLEPRGAGEITPASWINAAIVWRRNRLQYKGWHVLYRLAITQLWASTHMWLGRMSRATAESWQPPESIFILRELLWRQARALQPVPDDLVQNVIDPALERFELWRRDHSSSSWSVTGTDGFASLNTRELDEASLCILLELLRHAREIGDGSRFKSLKTKIDAFIASTPTGANRDARHFVMHQHILWTLSSFEHDIARRMLLEWDTADADDIWAIRRSGLMLQCGQTDMAASILADVLNSVNATRSGSDIDYALRSSEGLALHLLWHLAHFNKYSTPSRPPTSGAPSETPPEAPIEKDKDQTSSHLITEPLVADKKPNAGESAKDAVPAETIIRRRLKGLSQLGCDPYETLDWLRLQNEDKSPPPPDVEERESFDSGSISRSYRSGSPERLRDAYRAIRFIEEAALPLTIHGFIGMNVCNTLYSDAARVIASAAAQEGIGLILRSRDAKLVGAFLSRNTLATLNKSQVQLLRDVGLATLRRAIGRLDASPDTLDGDAKWWEQQLELAALILGRIVVLFGQDDVDEVAKEAVALAIDKRIWGRIGVVGEAATLIRRSVESLSASSFERFLPVLLRVPVPGSGEFPDGLNPFDRWYDPIEGLSRRSRSTTIAGKSETGALISRLLAEIASAAGKYRRRLVQRAVTLFSANLLTLPQARDFTAALFAQADDFGFPKDTGCYDSLVLGLPQRPGANEKALFRNKYIENARVDDDYWNNLKRTANRFGPPRNSNSRTIRWSRSDLVRMLDSAESWLPSFIARTLDDRKKRVWRGSIFAGLIAPHREAMREAYGSWLEAIEDVILLSPNVTSDHIARVSRLLTAAGDAELESVRLVPTLACLKEITATRATHLITRALVDRGKWSVWQACCGIARWSELTRAGYQPAIPTRLFVMLGALLVERRHERLALLLNTAKDLIEIQGTSIRKEFIEELLSSLKLLACETAYDSTATDLSTGERIHLRSICGEVTMALLAIGVDDEVMHRWMEIVRTDVFNEVRNSI